MAMQEEPKKEIVDKLLAQIDFHGLTKRRYPRKWSAASGAQIKEIKDRVVFTNGFNNLCFKCVKIDILDKGDDYPKWFYVSSSEDLIQSLPLFDKVKSISIINHCQYLYHTNPNGIVNTRLRVQNFNSR